MDYNSKKVPKWYINNKYIRQNIYAIINNSYIRLKAINICLKFIIKIVKFKISEK